MITVVNGQSEYIHLRPTQTKIFIHFAAGASGNIVPQSSPREGKEIPELLPDGTSTATDSVSFTVLGGGLFSVLADSVVGTITIETD